MLKVPFPDLTASEEAIVKFVTSLRSDWIASTPEAEFVWLHFIASHRPLTADLAKHIGLRLHEWLSRTGDIDMVNTYYGLWDSRVADACFDSTDASDDQ